MPSSTHSKRRHIPATKEDPKIKEAILFLKKPRQRQWKGRCLKAAAGFQREVKAMKPGKALAKNEEVLALQSHTTTPKPFFTMRQPPKRLQTPTPWCSWVVGSEVAATINQFYLKISKGFRTQILEVIASPINFPVPVSRWVWVCRSNLNTSLFVNNASRHGPSIFIEK